MRIDKQILLAIALSAIGSASQPAAADERRPTAELIALNCGACHGTYGRWFNDAMPPLAGMQPDKFVAAMQAFRDKKRPGTIMSRIAPAFNDADYRAMAEYFAVQKPEPYALEQTKK